MGGGVEVHSYEVLRLQIFVSTLHSIAICSVPMQEKQSSIFVT